MLLVGFIHYFSELLDGSLRFSVDMGKSDLDVFLFVLLAHLLRDECCVVPPVIRGVVSLFFLIVGGGQGFLSLSRWFVRV